MRVTMTQNATGCDDGIHAEAFLAGEEYTLSTELAGAFLADGVAVLADAPRKAVAAPVAEQAPVTKPAKNTAQKAPQRRKRGAK